MKSKEVDDYIGKWGLPQSEILERVRKIIKSSVKDVEEVMSYGVPAFKLNKNLFLYAVFKEHLGVYPTPQIIVKFKDELRNYETSKGTIKFPIAEKIPYSLIKKIAKYKLNSK